MSNIIPSDWRINSYNPGIMNEDIFGSKISTDYQVSKKDIYGTLQNDPNLNPVNVTDPSIQLNKLKGGQIDPSKITPRPKQTFSNKFANSTFGKNFGAWSNGLSIGTSLLDGVIGDKMYGGKYGNYVQGMNQGWRALAKQVGGPIGLGMQATDFLNMGTNMVLGKKSVDNMTKQDAFLNNPFTGVITNTINSLLGSNANTFTKNNDIYEIAGSSYGGTNNKADKAFELQGKRFGVASRGALKEANAWIAEADRQQKVLEGVTDITTDRLNLRNSMAAINGNRKAFNLQGGYDQSAMKVGRRGLKISPIRAKRILSTSKKKIRIPTYDGNYIEVNSINEDQKLGREPIGKNKNGEDLYLNGDGIAVTNQNGKQSYKNGGSITELVSFIKPITPDDILEFQNGGTIISPISYKADESQVNKKTRTLEELIKYAKEQNPRFIQRLSEEPRGITFTDDEGNEARGSHYLEWSTDDDGNAVIYPRIQENDKKELQFFNPNDAYIRAIQNKNFLIMSPEEAEIFFSEDPKYGTAYKSGWPQFFNKFEKGGSINVIPEGALHARKHNMDMEGITKKGIPVVSNNGEQQAEIEREEIIYRLEVTQKLEELMKKYYSENTSKKEKDELALEAGKLLTQETLYNTQDNTNNLI